MNLGRVGMGRVLCGSGWHGPSWFWAELSVIPRFYHWCDVSLKIQPMQAYGFTVKNMLIFFAFIAISVFSKPSKRK